LATTQPVSSRGSVGLVLDRREATASLKKLQDLRTAKQTPPADLNEYSCLFMQALPQLRAKGPGALRGGVGTLPFNVTFKGENGVDSGGLSRDALTTFIDELFADGKLGNVRALPLFCRTPNAMTSAQEADHRQCLVPNPDLCHPEAVQAFRVVGWLIGLAVRTQTFLDFNFPPVIWDRLLGSPQIALHVLPSLRSDKGHGIKAALQLLQQTEADLASSLQDILNCSKDEWDDLDGFRVERFASGMSLAVDMTPVALLGASDQRNVMWEERELYVRLVLGQRWHQADVQLEAIRKGLSEIVPMRALGVLNGADLKAYACGEASIDISLLQDHTTYGSKYSDTHPSVKSFWKALESLDNTDRARFLQFVWGRRKLPRMGNWTMTIKRLARKELLPSAHTCYFTLEWPDVGDNVVLAKRKLKTVLQYSASGFGMA